MQVESHCSTTLQPCLCLFWDMSAAMVSQLTDQCHGITAVPQVHLPHCAILSRRCEDGCTGKGTLRLLGLDSPSMSCSQSMHANPGPMLAQRDAQAVHDDCEGCYIPTRAYAQRTWIYDSYALDPAPVVFEGQHRLLSQVHQAHLQSNAATVSLTQPATQVMLRGGHLRCRQEMSPQGSG